jgi:hypothetical protein
MVTHRKKETLKKVSPPFSIYLDENNFTSKRKICDGPIRFDEFTSLKNIDRSIRFDDFTSVNKLRRADSFRLVYKCKKLRRVDSFRRFYNCNNRFDTNALTRVSRWVFEKFAQNVAKHIFVKIDTQPLQWKTVARKFGLLL